MAIVRTPKSGWIHAGLRALAAGGPEAVRVEGLAAALGVTKGGFYWHFADRKALFEEMLDTWERKSTEDVIASIDRGPGDPRAKLRQLFDLVPNDAGFAVEMVLRDWSRREPDVAARLHRVDNRRMSYLRSLFGRICVDEEEAEIRSVLAYSLVIGSFFIGEVYAGDSRTAMVRKAANRLLAESGT